MADAEKINPLAAQSQPVQQNPHAGALRAFLTGAARLRPDMVQAVKSLESLFSGLQTDKLIVVKVLRPTALRVSAIGVTITVRGMARRQGTAIVPCMLFSVDGRELPVKMIVAPNHTAWTWVENAGLGVSGQQVDAETTCRVFLALLAGEV